MHVLGEPGLVRRLEVLGPLLPVEEALVRHCHAVERRVVGAHDRARVRRRAVAGRRELVDVERLVAALAQLERRGRADHSGADDHCVDVLSHHVLRSLAFSLSRNAAWKRRTCSCMRACASAPSPRTIASTTRLVLGHRGAEGADAVERHAPQPQDVAVQPVELRGEQRVARRLRDRRVQLAIELDQRVVVARGERAARALDQRAQRLALLVAGALGGQAGGQAFELDAQLEDLLQVGRVQLGDERAAPRQDDDEVLPGQAPQGAAHGRQADAQLGRERRPR